MMFTTRYAAAIALLGVLAISCTQKRPDVDQQGQITDLSAISEFNNQSFPLETYEQFERAENTNAEKLKIDASVTEMNNYGYVRFKTPATLLTNDVPFRGKENSKYTVRYVVKPDENLLVIYKIADKSLIPHDEYQFAVPSLASGNDMAIPMLSYGILGFYRIEKVKNSDGEPTNVNMEVREPDFAKATHIRLDRLSKQAFEAIKNTDVYPAKYFDGDWYYARTVVAATLDKQAAVGTTRGGLDTNLQVATRIRFIPTKDYLLGVNLNIDSRLTTDDINYGKVIQLRVKWLDENVMKNIASKIMKPQERSVFWNEASKTLIKVEFEKSIAISDALTEAFGDLGIDLGLEKEKKLAVLEFTKDSFSFTLYDPRNQERVKHYFLRANNRNYEKKVYPEKDFDKFGFFEAQRDQVMNYELHRREDIFKNRFLARFNPASPEIVYHLTTSSPNEPWLNDIARSAVSVWNKAFAAAGTKIKIRLDESERVEIGDIRYNSINFIKALSSGSLGGVGPMLVDPFSGEIISSTSNIHVTTYLSSLTQNIREYIRAETGQLDAPSKTLNLVPLRSNNVAAAAIYGGNDLPLIEVGTNGKMKLMGVADDESGGSSDAKWFESRAGVRLRKQIEAVDGKAKIANFGELVQRYYSRLKMGRLVTASPMNEIYRQGVAGSVHLKALTTKCPEIQQYIEGIRISRQSLNTEDENKIVEPCAQKLAVESLVSTVVHEMGHNFGLRHNFGGSADQSNFLSAKQVKEIYGVDLPESEISRSSSVMDYIPSNYHELPFPGLYDIAAIRFGYGGKLELSNSKFEPLEKDESIEEFEKRLGALKSYKFCTDEDMMLGTDPMCQMHDYGATPNEVVDNLIKEYNDNLVLRTYRFDRIRARTGVEEGKYFAKRFISSLRRFYDQWRMILREQSEAGQEYLENIDPKQYAKMLERVVTKTSASGSPKEYLEVRNKIFRFFKDIALLPNRYCVVAVGNAGFDAVELEKIRRDFSVGNNAQSVASCYDSAVQGYLSAKGLKLVKEVGHPLDDTRFSLLDKDSNKPFDITGMNVSRMLAVQGMASRPITSVLSINRRFLPNMLDEPDLRVSMIDDFLSRLLLGADLTEYSKDVVKVGFGESFVTSKFALEKELLLGQFGTLKSGLFIPLKSNASAERLLPFRAVTSTVQQHMQGLPLVLDTAGGFIGVREEWGASALMAKKINEIDQSLSPAVNPNFDAIERIVRALIAEIPEGKKVVALGEVEQLVLKLQKSAGNNQNIGEVEGKVLEQLMGPELSVLQQSLVPLSQAIARAEASGADSTELKKKRDKMLTMDLTQIYEQNSTAPIGRESLLARFEGIKTNLVEASAVKANRTTETINELEAQREILLNALRAQM